MLLIPPLTMLTAEISQIECVGPTKGVAVCSRALIMLTLFSRYDYHIRGVDMKSEVTIDKQTVYTCTSRVYIIIEWKLFYSMNECLE